VGEGGTGEGPDVALAVGDGVAVADATLLVGDTTGFGLAMWRCPGITSSCPTESMSLLRLFNSMMAATVVLYRRAIPLKVSPGCTV
jgi:hypothetical protein